MATSSKKYITYGMFVVGAFIIIGIASSMLGIDSPEVLFVNKPMTGKDYQVRAQKLTTEGDEIAKNYFRASDEESFRMLRRLKNIAGDLGDLVADAKKQGVSEVDKLERDVNRWIAAKRYLLD